MKILFVCTQNACRSPTAEWLYAENPEHQVASAGVAPDATEAARLRPLTRSAGLSLADRACLALTRRLAGEALTADRAWLEFELADIHIRSIREPPT